MGNGICERFGRQEVITTRSLEKMARVLFNSLGISKRLAFTLPMPESVLHEEPEIDIDGVMSSRITDAFQTSQALQNLLI